MKVGLSVAWLINRDMGIADIIAVDHIGCPFCLGRPDKDRRVSTRLLDCIKYLPGQNFFQYKS